MASVALEGVTKTYRAAVVAVRDLTLRVEDGELVVLLGPSGCGKTTTLRLIAGLEEADAGTIRLGDRAVGGPRRDRSVAMVFQNHTVYPHMTVYGNLAFRLRLARVDRARIDDRVREMAALLGLDDRLDLRPEALSGGERQRLAVGRAFIGSPAVCLLDEPLSNLDTPLRDRLRGELKALQRRLGTTTLYVTHDQEEAMAVGDRIALLADGRLQQVGTPEELYQSPANRFVAGFVGSPPMNFIDGEISAAGDELLRFDGGGLRLQFASTVRPRGTAVLGLRPQDLCPTSGTGAVRPAVLLHVEGVSKLGPWTDVCGTAADGTRLTARLTGDRPPVPGDSVTLRFDPSRVHLFEPGPYGRSVRLREPCA